MLASASPRRAAILENLGLTIDVRPATIQEKPRENETAESFTRRVAEEKARVIAEDVRSGVVIGADTVVCVSDEILGKPADRSEARSMLRKLSGKTSSVVSGVALITRPGDRVAAGTDTTLVQFAPMSENEIDWYACSGEPDDKAGAYALQGLAALFITRIDGSPSNVIGLPVRLLYTLSAQVNLDLIELRRNGRPLKPSGSDA
ncbi:Maf family protein [Acidobacteriota bacterium]